MRGIEDSDEYKKAQNTFKSKFPKDKNCDEVDDCDWKMFKDAFFKFSKYLCPICEVQLINSSADIDHTRPKSKYKFLKCCCKNYLIMCADCNRSYKRTKFPLEDGYDETTDIISIENEKALLVKPREDDIYDYFELVFRYGESSQRKILILQERYDSTDDNKRKALETIKLYGLGDCNPSSRTKRCRIEVLSNHYSTFYGLAKRLDDTLFDLENEFKNNEERINIEFEKRFDEELGQCPHKELLKKYGFLEFLRRQQFVVAT
jgi:hypothetical protein